MKTLTIVYAAVLAAMSSAVGAVGAADDSNGGWGGAVTRGAPNGNLEQQRRRIQVRDQQQQRETLQQRNRFGWDKRGGQPIGRPGGAHGGGKR